MSNGLFVNISRSFERLAPAKRLPHASELHAATTDAWRIAIENAVGVEFLFGVASGTVRSAYRVRQPATAWPVKLRSKRCIIVTDGEPFPRSAFQELQVGAFHAIRYLDVALEEGRFRLLP